jgi:inosine-uridine nucleoside N-ribohydrolase
MFAVFLLGSCSDADKSVINTIPIIFDTDANNELDDQHALAYLVFNEEVFDVIGVTTNATFNGGSIEGHYEEAKRVLHLCNKENIPLIRGANANYDSIRNSTVSDYDGKKAVEFIINEARKERDQKLVLLPVGKLTNIALALQEAPDISDKVRIVWFGSNYPDPGEYNQINDEPALNYILNQEVPFEIVLVRYGKSSGSDAVRVTPSEVEEELRGQGPESEPVTGRHGGVFTRFGDYSVELFQNIDLHGEPPSRALFDMVAVAVLKNPAWGNTKSVPAPVLVDSKWIERPGNQRSITLWMDFNKEAILVDFFATIQQSSLS